MKNPDLKHEGPASNHPLKKLAKKIVTNFEGVNFARKDFGKESQVSARLGVIIDWSKGTMRLQGNS